VIARTAAVMTYPDDMTVGEARDRFLSTFGLDLAGYTAATFPVRPFRGVTLRFPNPGVLKWHDLHHIATGYPATVLGEAQISAFELRTGSLCLVVFVLCIGAVGLGFLRAPRLILRAWRDARGARSLYQADLPYETLLEMRVSELRRYVGLTKE